MNPRPQKRSRQLPGEDRRVAKPPHEDIDGGDDETTMRDLVDLVRLCQLSPWRELRAAIDDDGGSVGGATSQKVRDAIRNRDRLSLCKALAEEEGAASKTTTRAAWLRQRKHDMFSMDPPPGVALDEVVTDNLYGTFVNLLGERVLESFFEDHGACIVRSAVALAAAGKNKTGPFAIQVTEEWVRETRDCVSSVASGRRELALLSIKIETDDEDDADSHAVMAFAFAPPPSQRKKGGGGTEPVVTVVRIGLFNPSGFDDLGYNNEAVLEAVVRAVRRVVEQKDKESILVVEADPAASRACPRPQWHCMDGFCRAWSLRFALDEVARAGGGVSALRTETDLDEDTCNVVKRFILWFVHESLARRFEVTLDVAESLDAALARAEDMAARKAGVQKERRKLAEARDELREMKRELLDERNNAVAFHDWLAQWKPLSPGGLWSAKDLRQMRRTAQDRFGRENAALFETRRRTGVDEWNLELVKSIKRRLGPHAPEGGAMFAREDPEDLFERVVLSSTRGH